MTIKRDVRHAPTRYQLDREPDPDRIEREYALWLGFKSLVAGLVIVGVLVALWVALPA